MRARLGHPAPAAIGAMVVGLALTLRLPLLAGGQVDYDEGVYWQSLRNLAGGAPLFSAVYSSQPPAFLTLLLPAHAALGGTIVADRVGVLLFAAAGVAAAWFVGAELGSRWVGVAAAAVLAVDPLLFRQSVTLQADGPAMSLGLASLALAVAARRPAGGAALGAAAGAGALLALAVLTKLLAVAAAPAVALALAAPVAGERRWAAGRLGAGVAGGLVATALVLLPFAGSLGLMWQQVVGFHLEARGLDVGGLDAATVGQELPVALLGVAGAVVSARRAPLLAAVGTAWALAAVLLVAVQRPLWPHHLVVLTTPLALLAGGVAWPLQSRPRLALGAAAACALAAVPVMALTRSQQTPDAPLRPVVSALRAATAQGEEVVTDDPYAAALADRSTPPELVDVTRVRFHSGNLTVEQAEAATDRPTVRAVLLATGRLEQLPGFQEFVAARFPTVRDLGDGRRLYVR